MKPPSGRPRDPRIDSAVLTAAADLVQKVGYADLTIAAIAERAGTTKPAIYRRWPSKAHLVHEAVFPSGEPTLMPHTGSIAGDLREMLRRTADVWTAPAARAAMPGLMAEISADPTLHRALLERFYEGVFGTIRDRLVEACRAWRGASRRRSGSPDRDHRRGHADGAADPLDRPPRRRMGRAHRRPADERHLPMTHDSTTAWGELLTTLGELDQSFLEGSRAVSDDRHVADGYRMIATTLGVALDTWLFAEPTRPQFVELNTPFRRDRRWGGDNTDAYYLFAPIDETRRYRISGNRGDSAYFSLTAYNEPSPGAWSDQIVGIWNDDALDIDDDGDFSFVLEPTPGAAVLMTRDYQVDPLRGRPVSWQIEALDEPGPDPPR